MSLKKDQPMTCKYCLQEASIFTKFYTVDCCRKCHDAGRDQEKKKPKDNGSGREGMGGIA